jgi:hypothetical protein
MPDSCLDFCFRVKAEAARTTASVIRLRYQLSKRIPCAYGA